MKSDTSQLTLLGHKTVYKQDYAPEVLETFINKHPENDYWVRFNCPEFTSLCPITGQPDFATIQIDYIPGEHMVESKSLKLYLFSFRNHGAFHEDCVNIIMKDLVKLMNPSFIAFLVGSFLNAYVMSKMKISSKGKHFSLRAITSTVVGESADSLLFFPIAFGGVVPVNELLILIVTQACLKTAYEIVILPVTIRVVRFVKKIDGSDVYDQKVSYNIFKIKELQ